MTISHSTAQIINLPSAIIGKRIETVKTVRSAIEKRLFSLMSGLSFNVAEALFEEMRHLDEQSALDCHFNIMRSLKTEGEMLQGQLHVQMSHSWVGLIHGHDKQPIPDAPHDMTVVLKSFSDRSMNHYKVLLEELRLRFSHLSGKELSFHPLLPGNFYLSFWHATEILNLTYQERKLMLPLFNRFVMDRFGQILSIGNQTLADLDVPTWLALE